MAIKKPIPITFNLDSHQSVQSVCAVIHIDDKNTETLDLSLMQGGEHIAVSPNSTVTARFVRVKDKILISDNVACEVQENGNIYIPIDNAAAHMLVGEIKIEINIVDENDILTMQFPLVIRVNNTILADAEISPESEGTIPELLEEAREAAESATQAAEAATEAISAKQDKLTAGENITISEDNVISAEGGGVTSYDDLTNKPSINNVTLSGNKSSDDLNLQDKLTAGENITIKNDIISGNPGRLGFQGSSGIDTYPILGKVGWYVSKKFFDVDYYGDPYGHYISPGECLFAAISESFFDNISGVNNALINRVFTINDNNPSFLPPNSKYGHLVSLRSNNLYRTQIIITTDNKLYLRRAKITDTTHNWQELGSGGSQIISGVVNANGTITFTDSEGNTFTTSGESVIGADGYSPSATVQQTASGATITVTDKNGTTTANISNGQDGNDYVLTAQDKDDIADIVLAEFTGSIVNGELNTR